MVASDAEVGDETGLKREKLRQLGKTHDVAGSSVFLNKPVVEMTAKLGFRGKPLHEEVEDDATAPH